MTTARSTVLGWAAALLFVAAVAAGCSSSSGSGEGEGAAAPETSLTTTTTTTIAPLTTVARQSCSADTLGGAAAATFPGPQLADVVCETAFAAATVSNGPGGEVVALFSLEDGVWVLVGNSAIDAPASGAPAGFSPTVLPAWQRLRDSRLARGDRPKSPEITLVDTPPSSLGVDPETGDEAICTDNGGDAVVCVPVTTAPPVADPENPDAPPTTAQQSMFCKYNYNDPRCVADPGFIP